GRLNRLLNRLWRYKGLGRREWRPTTLEGCRRRTERYVRLQALAAAGQSGCLWGRRPRQTQLSTTTTPLRSYQLKRRARIAATALRFLSFDFGLAGWISLRWQFIPIYSDSI